MDVICVFFLQDLKHCSVLLDRLHADDDQALKKELEEKEDMNRKGGKHTSRIPTFHKRPSSVSQNAESPVPRKDTAVHVTQPTQNTVGLSAEAPKSKPPDARETALPLPSIRSPKFTLETPSPFTSTEQAATAGSSQSSIITAPKSWSSSGYDQLMTASPRPALRPEQGSEQHLPEQDTRKASDIESATKAAVPVSNLPHVDLLSQKPQDDTAEKYEVDRRSRISLIASESESEEITYTTEVSHAHGIMDEQPPWATEPMNILQLKDSRSSSDAECEEDLAEEKPEGHDSEEVEVHQKAVISKLEFSNPTVEADKEVKDGPSRAAKKSAAAQSSTSARVSFLLRDIKSHCLRGIINKVSHT